MKIRKWLRLSIKLLAACLLLLVLYSIVVVIHGRAITPDILKDFERSGQLVLSISDLSQRQIEILLEVQDPGFYEHCGMDLSTPGAGLTTLTQAVAKKLYFEDFKPGWAKIRQTLLAVFVLDSMVSKNEQLRLFINLVYLGTSQNNPIIGFNAAARYYYHKPIDQLTEDQYISLVAMLIAPDTYNLLTNPKANQQRTEKIKNLLTGHYLPDGLMDIYYENQTQFL